MKLKIKILAALTIVTTATIIFVACKRSFLDQLPQGVYDEASLTNRKGINGMLINAYAPSTDRRAPGMQAPATGFGVLYWAAMPTKAVSPTTRST